MLAHCEQIETYYMIDPWRRLRDWNKPANKKDRTFARIYRTAMANTQPWAAKRRVLRGLTKKMARRIPNRTLDFAYVDGDHTLRGITIDLIKVYPGERIYALPHNQFLIHKRAGQGFRFVDLTGAYGPLELRSQLTTSR